MASRLVLYTVVRRWMRQGRLTRRTVVVGGGEAGEGLIRVLRTQPDSDVRVIGVFDDRSDDRSPDTCGGLKKLGTVDDFIEFSRRTRVDLVVFSLPISAENRILQMLKKLWVLPIDIRLSAHSNKLRFRPRSYSYIGSVPVIDVFDRPIADWDVVMKWLFDKVVGGLALLAAAPLMVIIAHRDQARQPWTGPVQAEALRLQQRPDRGLQIPLDVCRGDGRDRLQARHQGRPARDPRRPLHPQGEPRRIAAALQRGVQGQPVAGRSPPACASTPRPQARLYDEAVDGYFARHRVKPGVTGWAQINGWRGETDTQEKIQKRVEYDLYYIENWSVLFDLYIVAMTPFALLKTENAY